MPTSLRDVNRQVLLDELDACISRLQPIHDANPDLGLDDVIGSMSKRRHTLAYRTSQSDDRCDDPDLYRFDMSDDEMAS